MQRHSTAKSNQNFHEPPKNTFLISNRLPEGEGSISIPETPGFVGIFDETEVETCSSPMVS